MKNTKFSLKYKLMIMLIGISAFVLLAFALLALNDFEKDKMAYVFDSTQSQSLGVAKYVQSKIESTRGKIQYALKGYDSIQGKIKEESKSFLLSDPAIHYYASFNSNKDGTFSKTEEGFTKQKTTKIDDWSNIDKDFLAQINDQRMSLKVLNEDGMWLFGLRYNVVQKERPQIFVVGLIQKELSDLFLNNQIQENYVLNGRGNVIIRPLERIYTHLENKKVENSISNFAKNLKAQYGIKQIQFDENEQLLVSVAGVGGSNLKTASFIPKSKALEAIQKIKYKVFLFLILMIFSTIFISVFTSNRLTHALSQLTAATRKIASGDFTFKVDVKNKDEIGELSQNFNIMSGEISRLLIEAAEKSRMASELETARLVQTTLFPKESFEDASIKIEGFYEPASECGGDWWFHSKIHDKYYLWIGDATGHGVPAALVTAAARAAASTVENIGDVSPDKAVTLLNKAIYNTARGQVLMTFFLGVFDPKTNVLTYVNASHDPPFLIPAMEEKVKKKHLTPLMDHVFPRLGESPDSEYRNTEITLNKGDRIFFYTDGITELKNPADDMYGERSLIKTLLASKNDGKDLKQSINDVSLEVEKFREGHPLEDDLTYFITEI